MNSQIVVISWWSNCLGLTCLDRLSHFASQRQLWVIQVGKTAAQKKRFRQALPEGVKEIPYPDDAPSTHSLVIHWVAERLRLDAAGLWFFDHDTFLEEEGEPWFAAADRYTAGGDLCLLTPAAVGETPGITQPAFWLAPDRILQEPVSLDPVVPPTPDRTTATKMAIPLKDTLTTAWEFLAAKGKAAAFTDLFPVDSYPLQKFPDHDHLGGLYLLAGDLPPGSYSDWTAETLAGLRTFFNGCPETWLELEDPVLLDKLAKFKHVTSQPDIGMGDYDFASVPYGFLTFKVDRRSFLPSILTELRVFQGVREGGSAQKLSELGTWSDDRLGRVIPELIQGSEIRVQEGEVWAQSALNREQVRLFHVDSPALNVFNMFNGINTLFEASDRLFYETGWEKNRCFRYTRGLFMVLVLAGVYRPVEIKRPDGKKRGIDGQ